LRNHQIGVDFQRFAQHFDLDFARIGQQTLCLWDIERRQRRALQVVETVGAPAKSGEFGFQRFEVVGFLDQELL